MFRASLERVQLMESIHREPKRVLLVDDNPEIHADYRKILVRRESIRDATFAFLGEKHEPEEPTQLQDLEIDLSLIHI